ncbi:MAG: hypothetical protein RR293_08395 [Bacteroidales bacterium]
MKRCLLEFSISFMLVGIGCTVSTQSEITEVYIPDKKEAFAWDILKGKDIDKLIFVKRFTYNSDHYYTEYINSDWKPGGQLCVLSLKTGKVENLVPSLKGGVYGAFDLSFDANRVVFAYKASKYTGYRIYEVGIDGNYLKQLTFSPEDEDIISDKYGMFDLYRGTEDLDPCYLPDGGIAFISTRCRYSTLCDAADFLTTTVMYRMDGDGGNMKQLSNGALSVLPDGRIMYTRWEYVDKGAVAVKCLWSMSPDGTNSSEIYGNNIAFPTTMIMARPIPDSPNEYVFTGTPHYWQNGLGTIVRVDVTKGTRTTEAMTYMTPTVDVQDETGWAFRDRQDSTKWIWDPDGKGSLFREAYPLNRSEFIVSHKPAGPAWADSVSYQVYLLKEGGNVYPIYSDTTISCFHPMVVAKRNMPPAIPSRINEELAQKGVAECVVTDVYQGMEGIERGSVRHLRILEQVPRPWGARRFYKNWRDDEYDQQHAVISKDTHLGLKIQHGVVTVESDGSAYFEVPAGRNIFLQALDSNFMALQTERTFVNYMPGEIRSCVGCHEMNSQAPNLSALKKPIALSRKAEQPYVQPGENVALRTLSYARDVQPIWDKYCVSCHNSSKSPGRLNLSGKETRLFNESYENLVPERRKGYFDRGVLGLVIGENHPKVKNTHYLPPCNLGSYSSILISMLSKGKIQLTDSEKNRRAQSLIKVHEKIQLEPTELLKVSNWVDTNCQYYGSYYGRRNIKYKGEPDYRSEYDVDVALQKYPQVPYE